MTPAAYGRPDLLAEPDWLWERRDDPKVCVIDCSSPEAYRRAHIPGASGLPIHNYLKDPGDDLHVMPAPAFGELMAGLGVSDGSTVVAYDDHDSLYAARLWWVLRYFGHHDARVLNGGWQRWLDEGRIVTFHAAHPARGQFTARPDGSQICRLGELSLSLGKEGVQVLDVRSEEEWLGQNDRGNLRAGHLPGAVHREWLDFMTRDDPHVFKPAEEIEALLQRSGLKPGGEVVTHCQAGIRGAHGAFVLTLLGRDGVRVYDASMKEWANRPDTPLVLEGAGS